MRTMKYQIYKNIDVDESGDSAVAHICQLFGILATNLDGTTIYLKIYNKATAPTVGTDTPVMTIPIPTLQTIEPVWAGGIDFSAGIGVGATTGVADNDTTGPGANETVITLLYK